ncbi:TPA: hypothetical protein U1Z93_001976 [Streptococcus suis]|uniref:Uncharacterized protein n=1 Tax=Streptococcus suis TaxID=1307 RepID=A0A7T1LAY6_STRSU|nr:hypothetical protein [Streptococcus suis]MCQ8270948.1 hypothetical protein [Streptococcus suis]MDW8720721.1 hypothetical protein [Streptococcus suis]QPO26979.1 hypothetical protein I5V48_02240 [Streptococcus suis]HEL1580915.1 hypothetical protein [Streptococcus suis]HEL1580993.1 hypothetical protein [Streptococcus suis]
MIIERELPKSAKHTEDRIFEEIIRDGLEQIVDKLLEECSTYEEVNNRLRIASTGSELDTYRTLTRLVQERAMKQATPKKN